MKRTHIFGAEMHLATQDKYLGIIIYDKFTWRPNVDNKLHKTILKCYQYTTAMNIIPMFAYGFIVWWIRTNRSITKLQLDHLMQRMVCIALTASMRTTPTAAIETL